MSYPQIPVSQVGVIYVLDSVLRESVTFQVFDFTH